MGMCMDRCCAQRDCNVAYMVDKNCFSVACYSPVLCKISDVSATNGDVEISTILNSTAEKPAEKRKSLFSPVACLSLYVFCCFLTEYRTFSAHGKSQNESRLSRTYFCTRMFVFSREHSEFSKYPRVVTRKIHIGSLLVLDTHFDACTCRYSCQHWLCTT